MPVYTVYHRSLIHPEEKEDCAIRLSNLHSKVTGAPNKAIKVIFNELDSDSLFSGGKRVDNYVRIVAEIRQGRTENQKTAILYGMYEIMRSILESGEIQTQIKEFDDTKTVMTDGVLNVSAADPASTSLHSGSLRTPFQLKRMILSTDKRTALKQATMPSPADPILASAMWTANYPSKIDSVLEKGEKEGKTGRLSSGCPAIDTALGGGLAYGRISCLNAEVDSGAREISEAYVVRHLHSSPRATATVIDTAMSFDVRKFHRALASEMDQQGNAAQEALQVLDRLKIMKVFDLVGLTDSISELRDTLEGKGLPSTSLSSPEQVPKGTIGDSEDEDEMLDIPSPPFKLPGLRDSTSVLPTQPSNLLMIDSITQIVAPLIKNQYAQGQAVLASFMRSLAHLTRMHHLCTILLNDATPNAHIKQEVPSIFSSCVLRPALGQSFAHMVDTSLLVHRVSMSVFKAQALNEQGDNQQRVGRLFSVLEVLQDRNGEAQGRWAPFSLSDNGRPVDVT